jgi:hypothetical protein
MRHQAIITVLLAHGIPAHWEFIGEIVQDLYPGLFRTAIGVRKFMEWHPERFEAEGEGVFSVADVRLSPITASSDLVEDEIGESKDDEDSESELDYGEE